jgi:hypothetical protein
LQVFLHGLLFNPENRGSKFLWNTSGLLLDYMALHPKSQYSSYSLMWEPQIQDNF